jgi:DNA-binding HxlR family transcriptional regulator
MKYDVIGKVNRNKCPLTHALNMIGGKWRLPIIWVLWNHETMRYNELKNEVEGITNMMLSQVLKEMESSGLIVRKQYMEIPPRVEYSLAQAGKELVPSLESLAKWGRMMQKQAYEE